MMDIASFLSNGPSGRARLAAALRVATAGRLPAPSDAMPDEVFLEPRLFAWSSRAESTPVTLGQLLYPALEARCPSGVDVASDDAGRVFVAGVGHFETGIPHAQLRLVRSPHGEVRLLRDGAPTAHRHLPVRRLPGSRIEWVRRSDPLLRAFLADHVAPDVDIDTGPQRYDPLAAAALEAIERSHPDFHRRLSVSVQSVVLFRHPHVASFAALGLHGMIFLNVSRGTSLPFFIEGLAHQGGHVMLSEATLDRHALFSVPPDTTLGPLTGHEDRRSVYDALHGLYTEYAVLDVLSRVAQSHPLAPTDRVELLGRMALASKRFTADVQLAMGLRDRAYSTLGNALVDAFDAACLALRSRCASKLCSLDIDGHGEDFDAPEFFRRNPAPAHAPFPTHLHGIRKAP